VPPREVAARAREAAARAVRADPGLAEAHTSLGIIAFYLDWDWPAAEAALRRAIALDSGYDVAHRYLAHVVSQSGRQDEARAIILRARGLDPFYAMNHAMSSQFAFQARVYPAALQHARQAIVVDPGFWIGHIMLGQAEEHLGRPDSAFEAFQDAARLSGGNTKTMALRGHVLARLGRAAEARDILRTLESLSGERYVPPLYHRARARGPGRAGRGLCLARPRLRGARRPSGLPSRRSQMGRLPGPILGSGLSSSAAALQRGNGSERRRSTRAAGR
jgi:tetratricopeptide (TPR) repeat protein